MISVIIGAVVFAVGAVFGASLAMAGKQRRTGIM